MNLSDFIKGAGDVLSGLSLGQKFHQWLSMNENEALNSIEEFVNTSTKEQILTMDQLFYGAIRVSILPDQKIQLTKYYTLFRVCEFNKFREWRGFIF